MNSFGTAFFATGIMNSYTSRGATLAQNAQQHMAWEQANLYRTQNYLDAGNNLLWTPKTSGMLGVAGYGTQRKTAQAQQGSQRQVCENGANAPQQLTRDGQTPVIGKMKDLDANGALSSNEFKVADYLPNKGDPHLNWQKNSGILRSVMNEGVPIRDASIYPMSNAGFLGLERNLLHNKGWTYLNGYWFPPQ